LSKRVKCRVCQWALLEKQRGEIKQEYGGRLITVEAEFDVCPLCDSRVFNKSQLWRAIKMVKEKFMREH